ncbi:MAG: hypothetical protein A7315_08885, partial [Candidatus Altiarchaeales archaeon WOR_SM1_79]
MLKAKDDMDIDKTIRSYIGSKHKLIGVRILSEESKKDRDKRPAKPMRYCQFIREAAVKGSEFILNVSDMSCPNAEICLGFIEPKYVDIQPRIMPANTKAVRIGKVEDSDVVLAVVTPKQMMELAVLLGGVNSEFRGEMALCGELTAGVFISKKPNVSFLCNGARMFAEFRDNEVVVGMPYETALKLAEKIEALSRTCGALCGCLTSDIPPQILTNFKKIGFEKGTDYFFGKVKGNNVRIYLNKDTQGRYNYITFHVPIKGDVKAEKPFEVKKRGKWSDIIGVFDIEGIGIDLYSGENLEDI